MICASLRQSHWQLPYPFSSSCINCIAQCRYKRWHRRFSDACRPFIALNDMYRRFIRCIRHSRYRVIMEIGLFYSAVAYGNFALQGKARGKRSTALELCFYPLGVNRNAAVNNVVDLWNPDFILSVNNNLYNARYIR